MRYSRFKNQIDPPSVTKKKNSKKGVKGDLKGDLQAPPTMTHPAFLESGIVPKLGPNGSPFQSNPNPFVKYEPGAPNVHGIQGLTNPQDNFYSPFPQVMSPASSMTSPRMMPSPQMMPPKYLDHFEPVSHGALPRDIASSVPLSLASGMYAPMPKSTPLSFTTCPSFPMSHDFNMVDFPSQTPGFNSGPVITWEPMPQQQNDSPPSPPKIKEEPGPCEEKVESVEVKTEQASDDKICIDL